MNTLCRVVLFTALLFGPARGFGADALGVWHRRSPLPTSETLNGVAYGNGRFVAVGDNGTVLSSSNATDWVLAASPASRHLTAVFFAEGRFLIGGDAGTILWSVDGLTWNDVSVPMVHGLTCFGFGRPTNAQNGLFLAMASPPRFGGFPRTMKLTSADGVSWQTNAHGTFESSESGYFSIAFGKERFVASGRRSDEPGALAPARAVYSFEGTNWTFASGSPAYPVAFGNGLFVSVVYFPVTNEVSVLSITSANGYGWPGLSFSASGYDPLGLCFGNGSFVAVGRQGCVAVSADGTNWTAGFADTDAQLRAVTYGAGSYVAVGGAGVIMTSPDGVNWTRRQDGTGHHLFGVAAVDDGFAAVGSAGSVTRSTNGLDWEQLPAPTTNALLAVLKANGKCVVAGGGGTLLSGEELTDLSQQATGTPQDLAGLGFGGGTWIAVGGAGTILSSANAANWVTQSTPTTNRLSAVAYGNAQFVVVGDNGTILGSRDGVSWSVRNSGTTRPFVAATYGNGRFVIVAGLFGAVGWVLSSVNGVDWRTTAQPLYAITGVCYGSGRFVIPAQGQVYSSTDGVDWSTHSLLNDGTAAGPLAFGNGTCVSVGPYGVILQSDPVIRLITVFDGSPRLSLEGPNRRAYRIEARNGLDDLAGWHQVTTLLSAPYLWTDIEWSSSPSRFYRAVLLPKE